MSNIGLIGSLLLIIVMVNLLSVFFAGVLGVPLMGEYVVYHVFSKEQLQSQALTGFDSKFESGFNKDLTDESSAGGLFVIFDGLKKVFGWFITILGFGFSLFYMLQVMGSPFILSALVGFPVAILFYYGIVSAVRGYSV
jgi:hypothetical protein